MSNAPCCCICKRKRPGTSKAVREGWRGCRVIKRGQRGHWFCPLHPRELHDVMDHAEAVADGVGKCEVA